MGVVVNVDDVMEELQCLRQSIDGLSQKVHDLRTSVHGNPELNIGGVAARVHSIEIAQEALRVALKALETERAAIKHWLRGAAWIAATFLTLFTAGGALGLNRMLELLNQIVGDVK